MAIECFYSSVFLFFECVWNYFCHTFQRLEGELSQCAFIVNNSFQVMVAFAGLLLKIVSFEMKLVTGLLLSKTSSHSKYCTCSRLPAPKRRKLEESEKPLLLLQAGGKLHNSLLSCSLSLSRITYC